MRHRREHSVPSEEMKALLAQLVDEEYCYVATTGRVSGSPHEIEIWFGVNNGALYLLSGGGENSDWVKNMRKNPLVTVRIGKHTFPGTARFELGAQEETRARHILAAKYQGWREGHALSNWARTALPVGIELAVQ
jgi:deazaflavin-dependent oxidoreductase (nitroreductase family)